MNKNSICSILFVLSLFVAACSKSDVNSTDNTPQIKTLTVSKLEIKKSSVKINTTNYVVEDFELDQNMTYIFNFRQKWQ
jgi:ABC-type Fe3+-citrate transport system substrate-binding protein